MFGPQLRPCWSLLSIFFYIDKGWIQDFISKGGWANSVRAKLEHTNVKCTKLRWGLREHFEIRHFRLNGISWHRRNYRLYNLPYALLQSAPILGLIAKLVLTNLFYVISCDLFKCSYYISHSYEMTRLCLSIDLEKIILKQILKSVSICSVS